MKNWKRCIGALLAALMSVVSISARNLYICEDPDEPAIFPGSIETGIPKFIEHNFNYPRDAWVADNVEWIRVSMIIDTKGKVVQVEDIKNLKNDKAVRSDLKDEIKRVLGKMTWYPANKDGNPVNHRGVLTIALQRMREYCVPIGLETIDKNVNQVINNLRQDKLNYDERESAENVLEEAVKIFPYKISSVIAYSTLESSFGKVDNAIQIMDKCWEKYQKRDPSIKYNYRDTLNVKIPDTFRYVPRKGIWVAIMRALQHEFNSSSFSDSAFSDVMSLIDKRIVDGKLYEIESEKDAQLRQRRMEMLRRSMVNEWIGVGIVDRTTPTWEKVTRTYSVDEISDGLMYWSDRGRIENAQVAQLKNLIRDERRAMYSGKNAKKESQLNLFGAKAFAIWMQEGDEGLDRFLAQIRAGEPSKQLLKYLSKLEKNMAENAALLSDRRAVLESLACLVPPEGTDVAGVKAFYDRRKAAEKVFPLKWLMK